jgi:chemotaxis protein CheX
MPFPVEAYQSEITQIVEDVFRTMMGAEVEMGDAQLEPPAGALTAAIFFAGAWKGAVIVEASEELAEEWTAELMSIPRPSQVTEDVYDTMGELVNMVAGNLKSVVPPGVAISIPTVVQGRQYCMKVCGGNLVHRQCFQMGSAPFWVTFVEVIKP